MNMPHRHLALVALALLTPSVGFSQVTEKCPTVWVDGPSTEITVPTPIVFTARLTGLNPTARPQYRWDVSAGSIVSGQGTHTITIDTTGLGGSVVRAKVSVGGVSTTCETEASRSSTILPEGIVCGLPFDSYGDVSFENEEARLDNFAIQLLNQETATGYIIVYAGKRTYEGEAAERLLRAKDYLVKRRQIDPNRIITVDGGYKEDFGVTLIIAPMGAAPPSAMPTLSPGEVEFTKRRRKPVSKKAGTIPR